MKHAVERMHTVNKEIFFNYQWAETGSGEGGGHASSKNREYGEFSIRSRNSVSLCDSSQYFTSSGDKVWFVFCLSTVSDITLLKLPGVMRGWLRSFPYTVPLRISHKL